MNVDFNGRDVNGLIGIIISDCPLAAIVIDRDLVVQAVNERFLLTFDFDEKNVAEMPLNKLLQFADDDRERFAEAVKESKRLDFQSVIGAASNIPRKFHVSISPLVYREYTASVAYFEKFIDSDNQNPKTIFGPQIYSTFQNQHIHQHNPASGPSILTLLDAIPNPVFFKDIRGVYQGCNQAFADQIIGLPREKIIGKTVFDLGIAIPHQFAETYRHQDRDLFSKGGVQTYEGQARCPDGVVRDFQFNKAVYNDAKGETAGLIGVMVDITDRKRIETRLREREERYSMAVRAGRTGVWEYWPESGKLIVDEAFYRIGGYDNDDIENTIADWTNIIYPQDRPLAKEHIEKLARGEISYYDIEHRLIKKNGDNIWVQARGTRNPEAEDNQLQIVGTITDITERKRAEKKLKKSELKYRKIYENIQDVYFEMDLDGRIIEVSPSIERTAGVPKSMVLGHSFAEMAVDPGRVRELIERLKRDGHVEDFEIKMRSRVRDQDYCSLNAALIVESSREKARIVGSVRNTTENMLARKKLEQSEERFRAIFRDASDAMVMQDVNGRILEANSELCRRLGYSQEEIKSLLPRDLETPKYANMMEQRLEEIRGNGFAVFETELVTRNGSTLPVEVSVNRISIDNQPVLLSICRDISDRKKAERQIKESREFLNMIINSIPSPVYVKDENQNLMVVNDAFCSFLGINRTMIIGRTEAEFMIEADAQEFIEADSKAFISMIPLDSEHSLTTFYGTRKEVLIRRFAFLKEDGVKLLIGIIMDLTDRKRAERALRKSERQYQELFNSVMEGIGIVDENEIIQFCNPALAQIYEEDSPQSMCGKCILDYISDKGREVIFAETDRRRMGHSSKYELDITSAQGNRKKLKLSISPRFDENGNYKGAFGAVVDITEMKRLQEFASRAQRLETAGRIAGQVAHDFNNLLGPLTAYPELIKQELDEHSPVLPMLEDMESASRQIAEINQQLLTLARRGHYNVETLNLNEIAAMALDQIYPLPEKLQIKEELEPNLMNVTGGKSQIYRVISNLISNARDAMEDNGKLIIKTENYYNVHDYGKYQVIPRGEYVKVTITDTGTGIPEDIIQQIFEPFFTTKKSGSRRGSGLGLSIVHTVVEDHNGFIDWDSKLGEGTSFYLYLPITRKDSTGITNEHIVGGNEKILVVDDDQMQIAVTRVLLEKLGYNVRTAISGTEALEILREDPHDIVVLDMIMPNDMDGAETYEKILEIYPHQKAIIVSGFAETDRVHDAENLGVADFLRKPLTIKSIAHAVRRALDSPASKSSTAGSQERRLSK